VPVRQGLHIEKDPDDRPICDFIVDEDAAFVHCLIYMGMEYFSTAVNAILEFSLN
jgi:hypothetical protein